MTFNRTTSGMNREKIITELQGKSGKDWDIIVIGGGATGLGIALDAITRGYKTILLEQSDFAKGTSSRSTKLVHGGVRYLAQGDILLVTEALRERGRILKNAPHLTANQEFIIPVYTIWDAFLYTAGLKFYDLLAGNLSLGRSYFIKPSKVYERLPVLKRTGLKGGIVYHDGQFDDSRMAITIAGACLENGGSVINYFKVKGLIKNENGRISGVKSIDLISGDEYSLNANLVINATGIFTDEIHRMDNPSSGVTIRPSQGVHVVVDNDFLQSSSAIMIPETDDGRVLFAIPWYGKVVIGTTDTPLDIISSEPKALDEEVDFILKTAGKYLAKGPERSDALCIFAGLRPLASDPGNPLSTKEVSRLHKITISSSGLLSIIGGKWTSYRRMAEDTIDKAIKTGMIEQKKCNTKDLNFCKNMKIPGKKRLMIYGKGGEEIEKMISSNPEYGEPLHPSFPYTKAEIIWICRNEMPVRVEDILARRTRALFLDARASIEIASLVAGIMAQEFGLDKRWEEQQQEEYKKLVLNYL